MKIIPGAARIKKSLKKVFIKAKTTYGHERYPDRYYRNVYIPKNLFQGIEIVAKIEQITKKNATELLLEAGLSKYMGKKVGDYIEAERIARETNQPVQTTRFNTIIRRYAREKGLKIGDIF